jgi:hypothetical protein
VSTLIVEELETVLEQEIKVSQPIYVATIRPWLYCHNNPVGTFYFNIYGESGLVKSFSFSSNDIKAACSLSEAYFHARYAISMTPFLLPRGIYTVKFEHSGYSYDANSFIGWCKDLIHFGRKYGNQDDYTGNPYSFTIIQYKAREI